MAQAIDKYDSLISPKIIYGLSSDDTIYIQLSSATDPDGKCVSTFQVTWVPYFACGSYAPRIEITADEIKFLALRSDILSIFKKMEHGAISIRSVLTELSLIGERRDLGGMSSDTRTKDEVKELEIKNEIASFLARADSLCLS